MLGRMCSRDFLAPPIWHSVGVPRSLEDHHRQFIFRQYWAQDPMDENHPDGDSYATLQLLGALHLNSAHAYDAAALAGLGLIQAPTVGDSPIF